MTRQIGGSTWSPDGKQVAFISNISGRNNLWLVPATGGWPTQLTISDQRQSQPVWAPDGPGSPTPPITMATSNGTSSWSRPRLATIVNLTISPDSAEVEPAWSPNSRAHRLCHEAQDRLQLRNRVDGCSHAPHRSSDEKHAQRAEQRRPDFFARWQVRCLHAVARQRQRFQRASWSILAAARAPT